MLLAMTPICFTPLLSIQLQKLKWQGITVIIGDGLSLGSMFFLIWRRIMIINHFVLLLFNLIRIFLSAETNAYFINVSDNLRWIQCNPSMHHCISAHCYNRANFNTSFHRLTVHKLTSLFRDFTNVTFHFSLLNWQKSWIMTMVQKKREIS